MAKPSQHHRQVSDVDLQMIFGYLRFLKPYRHAEQAKTANVKGERPKLISQDLFIHRKQLLIEFILSTGRSP